jgi:hypothetical protein
MVDRISALVAVLTPDGAVDYFGKTLEELKDWSSTDAVHPDDLRVSDCRMEAGLSKAASHTTFELRQLIDSVPRDDCCRQCKG